MRGIDHRFADPLNVVDIGIGFRCQAPPANGSFDPPARNTSPLAVWPEARGREPSFSPHMADTESIDETIERHAAPGLDRLEQVSRPTSCRKPLLFSSFLGSIGLGAPAGVKISAGCLIRPSS